MFKVNSKSLDRYNLNFTFYQIGKYDLLDTNVAFIGPSAVYKHLLYGLKFVNGTCGPSGRRGVKNISERLRRLSGQSKAPAHAGLRLFNLHRTENFLTSRDQS